MTLTVSNSAGESVQLAGAPFAQGGEAAVFVVPAYPGVVVKIFHPHVLQTRGDVLREKIIAMSGEPGFAAFKQHPGLAWPRFPVFDDRQQWRGFAMRRCDGVRMNVLAHAMAYREHFPALDRRRVVAYLLDLLGTVRDLHAANVMIGDYNPANFLCHRGDAAVTLIDCDSWQVDAAGRTYRSAVAAPDMLAPELLGKELGAVSRTLESERFSLAILLFKVLMLGRHPFDVVGGSSPVDNIRNGYFPYGVGGGGIPKGPWFNIWSHLPFKLKESLIHTFKEGCRDPSARASAEEWIDLLRLYQRDMGRGWHTMDIKPTAPKPKEYRGTQSVPQAVPV